MGLLSLYVLRNFVYQVVHIFATQADTFLTQCVDDFLTCIASLVGSKEQATHSAGNSATEEGTNNTCSFHDDNFLNG